MPILCHYKNVQQFLTFLSCHWSPTNDSCINFTFTPSTQPESFQLLRQQNLLMGSTQILLQHN